MDPTTHAPPVPRKVKFFRHLKDIPQLTSDEIQRLAPVEAEYAFRVTDYYLDLIDWSDPDDPLRRLVIPDQDELRDWGDLDPSCESDYTVAPGCQHKYPHTAILLAAETCTSYCRYCFRKRLFMRQNEEVPVSVEPGLAYIADHPSINNVLVTGGDPLILATSQLADIIRRLREMDHVRIIRIGTKTTAFNPYRILDDPALLKVIRRYSAVDRRIYMMNHFTHPRELTPQAIEAVNLLRQAGAVVVNQCPMVRGVNDDPNTLAELIDRLSFIGLSPYYVFQGRPTRGNAIFEVPIVEGYLNFQKAMLKSSGLGRRARFVMSHHSGKIEVVGVDSEFIYLRFHRAAEPEDGGRFVVCHRDDQAIWFDDLEEFSGLGARLGDESWSDEVSVG